MLDYEPLTQLEEAVPDWRYSDGMNRTPVKIIRPPMTEDECERAARAERYDLIASMWDAIGKEPEERRIKVYLSQLSKIPTGLLRAAIARASRDTTYNVIPTPGRIWEALKVELHNPLDVDAAIERWASNQFEQSLYRFGG